jgi:hypothetical protein
MPGPTLEELSVIRPARSAGRSRIGARAQRAQRVREERHRRAIDAMIRSRIPFLIGGGYALQTYAPNVRSTNDLDVFVRRCDAMVFLGALSAEGLDTELRFPHWLGKARIEGESIDVIYSSGNGVAEVDDDWFMHAVPATVCGVPVRLSAPEEMIWSKAFVMERERYDGADIAHLILACRQRLDWRRLLDRFGRHWRVLLSHLTLFGFVYPGERDCVPRGLILELCRRLAEETRGPMVDQRLCQGTLLSREQYLVDVSSWGYADGRLPPAGSMTPDEVALWTAAIADRAERPCG